MEIISYDVELESVNHGFVLIPFACTHWEHPGCNQELFKEFVDRAKNPRVYTLGLGDYLDFARSHYRNELRKVMPDEDSPELLDSMVRDRLDKYIEVVDPLADRCMGLISGNHTWQFMTTDGLTKGAEFYAGEWSDQYIARQMGIPYLGYTAIIRINVTFKDSGWKDSIHVIANHGMGNSSGTAGTDLGSMERKYEPAFDVDLYVMAHTHRRFSYFMPEITLAPNGKEVVEKSKLLVKAGSFLKAYLPGKETYASRKLLRPLDLGWVEVEFNYREKRGGLKRRMSSIMTGEYWIKP
jgi:hypothetical protein